MPFSPTLRKTWTGACVLPSALLVACSQQVPAQHPEPLHHELEVQLQPEDNRLQATDRFRVRGGDHLSFTLHPALEPQEVSVDGETYSVGAEQGIPLTRWVGEEPLDSGDHRVRIRYAGRLPKKGDPDFREVLKGVAPRVAKGGTFLGAGTGWAPDPGASLVTYRLRVTTPEGHRSVAPGSRKERRLQGQKAVTVFQQKEAVEGITLLGGAYAVEETRTDSGIPVAAYLHPGGSQRAGALLDGAAWAIEHFSDRYGSYPYRRFSVVSSPLATGFGYPGIAYLDRRILHLPFVPRVSLPHEVLHNWWGSGVMVAPGSGNWAEGLTTFGADHQLRARRSPEAARSRRRQWLEDFATYHRDGPAPALRDFRDRVDGASRTLGYNKAAFLWLMLRDRLGAEPFREGLRRFYRQHLHTYADWQDLRDAFETAADRDLGWFFAQWLDRPGAPRIRIAGVEPGGQEAVLSLAQEGPPYRLRLPVRLAFADGSQRTETVELTGKSGDISLATGGHRLVEVRVDPGYRVFRRLAPEEVPPRIAGVLAAEKGRAQVGLGPDRRGSRWQGAATGLGRGVWGRKVPVTNWEGDGGADPPAVLIVSPERLEALWQTLGGGRELPEWPGEADARVVVGAPDARGPAVALIAARTPADLAALGRPLPHYGSYGWLAFHDGNRLARGRWPVTRSPLSWRR